MTKIHKLSTGITDHSQLIRDVHEIIAPGALTKRAASKQIGVSAATLSLWLDGTYNGNNDNVAQKVARWLRTQEESARVTGSQMQLNVHCDLDVSLEILGTLANGQAQGDIVVICGPSGAGKTWGASHYRDTHSATWMVQMTKAVSTLNGMLTRISVAIDAVPKTTSALSAEAAIIEALRDRDALLIIDEAHHLSPSLIDELRSVRDLSGCGLALVGDRQLQALVRTCPQVQGRVGASVTATPPRRADVSLLAESVLGRTPSRKDTDLCLRAASLPGGMHTLRRMFSSAWIDAQGDGQSAISTQNLVDAVSDLTDLDTSSRDEALREALG